MEFHRTILRIVGFLGMTVGLSAVPFAAEDQPDQSTRLIVGLGSANRVMDTLEYMVDKLAGKKETWDNDIKPNLEIFLIGVDVEQPIRFDQLIDPQHGQQTQPIIPISNLKEFLQDNLDPIDIQHRRDPSDKNLYELFGNVFQGWLRYLPEPRPYGIIFPQKEAIPQGMPHPEKSQTELVKNGEIVFLLLKNSAETLGVRTAAFEKVRQTAMENFQKLTDESRDQYELRKRMQDQMLALLQQWFVETSEVKWGLKVDLEKGTAPAQLRFAPLAGTELEKDLKYLGEHGSVFAAVESPADATLTMRVNVPVSAGLKGGYQKVYELARPVVAEKIDADQKASAAEKAARKEVATLFLDVLTSGMDKVPALDAFADILPVQDKHLLILGIASPEADKVNRIIEKLPAVQEGLAVEMNVDKVGKTAIHKLKFGKELPKSLADFYGNSGEVFLGVNEGAFWLAGGEGSLQALKTRLEAVDAAKPAASSGVLVSLQMNVGPILKNVHDLMNEENFKLLDSVKAVGRIESRREQKQQEKGKESSKEEERSPRKTAGALATFQWQETAIAALQGSEDRLDILIKLDQDGSLHGTSDAQKGVLKAVGAVIAKFAEENLK